MAPFRSPHAAFLIYLAFQAGACTSGTQSPENAFVARENPSNDAANRLVSSSPRYPFDKDWRLLIDVHRPPASGTVIPTEMRLLPGTALAAMMNDFAIADAEDDYVSGCELCLQRAYMLAEAVQKAGYDAYLVWNKANPSSGRINPVLPNPYPWYVEDRMDWAFHVAPVVRMKLSGGTQDVVIDPLFSRAPLTFQQWLGLQQCTTSTCSITTNEYYCKRANATCDALSATVDLRKEFDSWKRTPYTEYVPHIIGRWQCTNADTLLTLAIDSTGAFQLDRHERPVLTGQLQMHNGMHLTPSFIDPSYTFFWPLVVKASAPLRYSYGGGVYNMMQLSTDDTLPKLEFTRLQ